MTIIVAKRMTREQSGLVHDQDVPVLVQNLQGEIGIGGQRRRSGGDQNFHGIGSGDGAPFAASTAVDEHNSSGDQVARPAARDGIAAAHEVEIQPFPL
jgi:hypothetical protein